MHVDMVMHPSVHWEGCWMSDAPARPRPTGPRRPPCAAILHGLPGSPLSPELCHCAHTLARPQGTCLLLPHAPVARRQLRGVMLAGRPVFPCTMEAGAARRRTTILRIQWRSDPGIWASRACEVRTRAGSPTRAVRATAERGPGGALEGRSPPTSGCISPSTRRSSGA